VRKSGSTRTPPHRLGGARETLPSHHTSGGQMCMNTLSSGGRSIGRTGYVVRRMRVTLSGSPLFFASGRERDDAPLEGLGDGFGAIGGVQFAEYVADVNLHRALGDGEVRGDLAVAFAGDHQLEHFELAR
jgi:hypothetical protein